jgi:cation diffusion facilitator family transporter
MALALRPPDRHHPWGYGKHETFAALFVSVALLAAVGLIAWQSISDILRPHDSPRWYTLPVLVGVVVVKIRISRTLSQAGKQHGSRALQADSWHHLSDALTSAAAFVGIVLALVGGEGWESADDWAALTACVVIIWNSLAMGHSALQELSESMVDVATERRLRRIGEQIEGVEAIEKMRARRSGRGILMDIHVQVDGNLTVTQGHHIAGCVKYALLQADEGVADVTVHIEPHGSGQQT